MKADLCKCRCGGEAKVTNTILTAWMVLCEKCHISAWGHSTEAEAVEIWNRVMSERTAKVKSLEKESETSISWEGVCTHCGCYTMHGLNYCFGCGAKLDWEKE